MSQFVVSARKYRPTSFKEVFGQAHVTTTLQNALATKQLGHAFLFCGPRGVGKTTCARILAKAINCLALQETAEPCNACAHCKSFQANRAANVYELDAASNNSVEDIRELVDQVRYAPPMGNYKIYIIDEVHMLSNAAFNAFLKTLEEPPSYALFVLATTERHKVLPTVASRCQTFHFNRIKTIDIVEQLQAIAAQERIACELPALQLIAQQAEGAMRDALSLFDLMHASVGAGHALTYARAREQLNVLDPALYFKATDAFLGGDVALALTLLDGILRQGFSGDAFAAGLGEHLRNLLVCQEAATLPLLDVTDNLRPHYAAQAERCNLPFLLRSLKRVQQCDATYKASHNQRLHVELMLIDLAAPSPPSGSGPTPPTDSVPKRNHSAPPKAPTQTPPAVGTKETAVVPTLASLKASVPKPPVSPEPPAKKKAPPQPEPLPPTQEQVQRFLESYGAQLKERGNAAACQLLNQPVQVEGNCLTFPIPNRVQETLLQQIKEELVAALRTTFHHPKLQVQVAFVEQPKSKRPYTDREKLLFLTEKNSAVALLQKRLQLEVAY